MEEILLRIGSRESYDAIKSFADKLADVELVESSAKENFPFSKEVSDQRIALALHQFSEGNTISLAESKTRTAQIIDQKH
jgi:hypothetical protein